MHDARQKTKTELLRLLSDDYEADVDDDDFNVGVRYDEDGRPRPARMAYDVDNSDGTPAVRAPVRSLPPETVPSDDEENPFPGLDGPLGSI